MRADPGVRRRWIGRSAARVDKQLYETAQLLLVQGERWSPRTEMLDLASEQQLRARPRTFFSDALWVSRKPIGH
jgi:hypothetical protein